MSAVCQFNQHGHCKFGSKCDKFHTTETCDNFPCQDNDCSKRHPKLCKYFSAYGRCMFGDKCSFLHYNFSRGEHTASDGLQEFVQAVSGLKDEVRTLRLEVDKLGNENRHLLEMIKDLKEEIDVDRVTRASSAHVTRPEADSTSGDDQPEVDHAEIVQLCGELVAACQQRDATALQDALDGIATILTTAEKLDEVDKVATTLEECGGLHRIQHLQHHHQKAVEILKVLYPDEFQDDEEVDHRTKAKVSKENGTGKKGAGYNGGRKKSTTNSGRGQQNSRKK